jgi:hypothetical protein
MLASIRRLQRVDPRWIGRAALIVLAAATGTAPVATKTPVLPAVKVYDADPHHLWNRLHAALFVRIARDGREYGADRVDPLLWIGSKYLLDGPRHEHALAALREFVDTHGERLMADPLKRAVMQRDLWAVFDWLSGEHANFAPPPLGPDVVRTAVSRLRAPLATAIARLALTRAEIGALPDNYAAAVRAGTFPHDILADKGGWVLVGRPDGPVAAHHVRDAGPGKNSVFLVAIRLPDGRAATLRFIERLRSFPGALWVGSGYPNPDLPQFPAGTRVALVRRALLVDTAGEIVPTRLTEQVQLRTYREVRPMTAQEFEDAHRVDESMFARAGQDFEEFSLSRADLLAHRGGGLLPLSRTRPFFLTFSSQGIDEFELRSARTGDGERDRPTGVIDARRLCRDCHAAPGVYSFNAYFPFRLMSPGDARAARLSETSLAAAEQTAVEWKEQQVDWRTLQGMLGR